MKCILYNQNKPCIDIDLFITPYKCEAKSAFLICPISEKLNDICCPDGDIDLSKLSEYLSQRISHTIKCMKKLDLLQCLNLQSYEIMFSESELPLFLTSFLWHLETGDGIAVYPKQTEYLCFTESDERFKMVYRVSNK